MADHEPGHVKEAAKETAAVKGVELAAAVVMVGLAVVAQWAQRRASDPDATTTLGMAWARRCETGWAAAAGVCWRLAEHHRRTYERGRYGW